MSAMQSLTSLTHLKFRLTWTDPHALRYGPPARENPYLLTRHPRGSHPDLTYIRDTCLRTVAEQFSVVLPSLRSIAIEFRLSHASNAFRPRYDSWEVVRDGCAEAMLRPCVEEELDIMEL